jgi:hypothetical protein
MRKKPLLILFSLLLLNLTLAANESFIPHSAFWGMGNDRWTYGLSRNDDDRLTFSFNLSVEADRWTFESNLKDYTNRGWKDAWPETADPDSGSFYDGRYDLMENRFGYIFHFEPGKHFHLDVTPKAGLNFAGNLGLQYCQNLLHGLIGIPEVNLDYDGGNDVIVSPYLGLNLDTSWPLARLAKTDISGGLSLSLDNSIFFEYSQTIRGNLFFKAKDYTYLTLSMEYRWYQNATYWSTQEVVKDYVKGLHLGFILNAGPLRFTSDRSLFSTQGFSTITFDALSLFDKPTWKENDFFFTQGETHVLNQFCQYVEFEIPISPKFSLLETMLFTAGNPDSSDLGPLVRRKILLNEYVSSCKYHLPNDWSKQWCSFYLSAGLGLVNVHAFNMENMDPDAALPYTNDSRENMGVFDFRAGVEIFPPDYLKSANISYNFGLFCGVQIFTGKKALSEFGVTNIVEPLFGLALELGLDI